MSITKCIKQIQDAAKGEGEGSVLLDEADAMELLTLIDQKVTDHKAALGPDSKADPKGVLLKNAAKEVSDEFKLAKLINKRNAMLNVIAEKRAYDHIKQFKNPDLGFTSFLVGINSNVKGSRHSISAQGKAIERKWVGGLLHDLEQQKLVPHFNSKELDQDVARALWALDAGPEQKINIKNIKPEAIKIAKIVKKYQDLAVSQQNSVGAFIKKLPGYIVRQSHDQTRIRKAGFNKWKQTILQHIDDKQTFKGLNSKEIDEFIESTYAALSSGKHLQAKGSDHGDALGFMGPKNLAKRVSAKRVLHFKSADDWMAYNESFGTAGLSESIVYGLEHAAKNTALMHNLGTNPEMMFNKIRERLIERNRDNFKAINKLRSPINDSYFSEINGSSRVPVNQTMAKGGSIIRAVHNMAKLGAATLSAITDVPFHASELRYQGHGLLKSYSSAFEGILKGRSGAERREIADLIGVGFEGMTGTILSRFGATDSLPGQMSKLQQGFFRLNLLSWWTDSQKTAAGLMMSRHMFLQRNKKWSNVDSDLRRTLGLYNIDEKKWDIIRSIKYKDGHVTPDAIRELSDTAILEALGISSKTNTGVKFHEGDLVATGEKPDSGSSPGGFFKDKSGKEFFVKYEDPTIARNEILTNRLYQLLGVRVLDKNLSDAAPALKGEPSGYLKIPKSATGVVTPKVELKKIIAKSASDVEKIEAFGNHQNVRNDFAIHAWLANWDVLGLSFDNMQLVNGIATQIDEGGSLLFRGLGEPKGALFTSKVGELDSFQGKGPQGHMAGQSYFAFSNLTQAEIKMGASKVAGITDDQIKTLVNVFGPEPKKIGNITQDLKGELIEKLISRRDDIINKLHIKDSDKIPTFLALDDLVKKSTPTRSKHRVKRYRDELEDDLRMYYTDRTDYAVPTPGDREQGIMKLGQQPGTALGEALRFIMQFKSFPITVLTKPLGREVYGSGKANIKGLAHLIFATTIFGYLAMAAKDVTKGRKPRDPDSPKTWAAAFTQGGGAGIYGDFMFGEFNRFGRSFTATAAGPTFGQMDDVAELYSRFVRKEDTAAQAVRFAMNNTPGINLFYTRAALDYFILYNIQEAVNPGYLRRLEKRISQNQGQSFYKPPSSVIKYGGGYR